MSKQEKKALMPTLRFPEFRDAGEWEEKALSKLTPVGKKYGIVDGPFGSNLKTIHYQKEGIPIITSGYVTEGFFYANRYDYVTNEKFEKEKRSAVKGGDIVMAKIGARCGASAFLPIDHETGILSGNALKITIDESRFSAAFVWQQLWYLHISQRLDGLKKVGAQPAISIASLKKFELVLPTKKEEQQKISDCLTSIDELVTAQTQKLDALKAHKKGLMQQLFPAEGETVPKLRFPEFRDAEEWVIKPLESLLTIGNGKDYKHLSNGDVPVYGSGGYMLSVDEHLYDGESVCIGRKGTINNPMFLSGKFWTVDTLFYTHSFKDCLPKFAYLIFQNINWLCHNEAGGVPSLSKTNINKIEVAVPSPVEQKKIAKCIFSIDELITVQTQRIESLKAHKKGLMQQLFPAMNEVSA